MTTTTTEPTLDYRAQAALAGYMEAKKKVDAILARIEETRYDRGADVYQKQLVLLEELKSPQGDRKHFFRLLPSYLKQQILREENSRRKDLPSEWKTPCAASVQQVRV